MFNLQLLLGRVCTIADLQTKDLPLAKRAKDGAIYDFPCHPPNKRDEVAARYLHDLLTEIEKTGGGMLSPVMVDGDGYCLTHSFSKHFFGLEIFYHVLRAQIHDELVQYADWYMGKSSHASSSSSSSGGTNIDGMNRTMYPPFSQQELDELIKAAEPTYGDLGEWSPIEHCQAIANVLRRPICLFSSLTEMQSGASFIFVPLRHSPHNCYKYPIAVAWQQSEKNHFVPLCRASDACAPIVPMHCQPPFFRCDGNNNDENLENKKKLSIVARQYLMYNADDSFQLGQSVSMNDIDTTHLIWTMGCRYKPHKPTQPGFFHGLIDKLIGSALKEVVPNSPSSSSSSSHLPGGHVDTLTDKPIGRIGELPSASSASLSIENTILLEDQAFRMAMLPSNIGPERNDGWTAVDVLLKLFVARMGFAGVNLAVTSSDITSSTITTDPDTYHPLRIPTALQSLATNNAQQEQSSKDGLSLSFKQEIDAHVAAGYLQFRAALLAQYKSSPHALVTKLCVEYRLAMLLEALVNIEYTKYLAKLSIRRDSVNDNSCNGSHASVHASQSSTMNTMNTLHGTSCAMTASFSEEEKQTYALFSSCNVEASRYLQHTQRQLIAAMNADRQRQWTTSIHHQHHQHQYQQPLLSQQEEQSSLPPPPPPPPPPPSREDHGPIDALMGEPNNKKQRIDDTA